MAMRDDGFEFLLENPTPSPGSGLMQTPHPALVNGSK